jgi:hypothetical protein
LEYYAPLRLYGTTKNIYEIILTLLRIAVFNPVNDISPF